MSMLQSRVVLHRQAIQRSLHFMRHQSITSVVTILMIALVLLLCVLFGSLSTSINQLTSNWQHSGHILLYLEVPTDPQDANHLLTQIQTTAGVREATLHTPQQGLEFLHQQGNMDDAIRYLPNNPLPFVIDVIPAIHIDTPDHLEQLYRALKAYPHVEDASLDLAWMKRLFALLHGLSTVLNGLNILLAVTVVLIIGNTLRLIIRDRADEMIVFKLVGASDAYIMRPFLYSGVWYGLLAALLAAVGVDLFLSTLNQNLIQFSASYPIHFQISTISGIQVLYFLIGASVLGWLGALLPARWILRNTE